MIRPPGAVIVTNSLAARTSTGAEKQRTVRRKQKLRYLILTIRSSPYKSSRLLLLSALTLPTFEQGGW
jgi:hypothetical protein